MLQLDNGQLLGYVWQQVAEEWTNYIVCMQRAETSYIGE